MVRGLVHVDAADGKPEDALLGGRGEPARAGALSVLRERLIPDEVGEEGDVARGLREKEAAGAAGLAGVGDVGDEEGGGLGGATVDVVVHVGRGDEVAGEEGGGGDASFAEGALGSGMKIGCE